MNRYHRIILILFCITTVWASIWVPLRGKMLNMPEYEIVSYHWVWNTDGIYWHQRVAIPAQVDYGRLMLTYVSIAASFWCLYLLSGFLLRRRMLATQSEIEETISSENMKCPKCHVAPLVGVDGKRQEVFLLCPKCETEWYFRQEPIQEMTSSLRRCLTESDRFPVCVKALKIKKVQNEKKPILNKLARTIPSTVPTKATVAVQKESPAKQSGIISPVTDLEANKNCPQCGKELHYKDEGSGAYWHCNYPKCSFVEVIRKA